jgi:hypothetical protein
MTVYIVAYLLKARIVEPEEQPLLGNGCVSTQQQQSHCYAMGQLLKTVFSMWLMPWLHKELIVHCELLIPAWKQV